MKKVKNLVGQKFGRWTVLSRAEDKVDEQGHHFTRWNCRCECGTQKIVYGNSLTSGRSKSCGCYRKEVSKENGYKSKGAPNKYEFDGDCGIGYTINKDMSVKFYFDIEDYDKIKQYRWKISEYGYIICTNFYTTIRLHRIILDAKKDQVVDHIDRNPLNNRKSNLRISSPIENAKNQKIPSTNKSGCAGVSRCNNKWRVYIRYHRKRYSLGCYDKLEDAIMARLTKEIEICDDLYHRSNTELMKKYNLIK